MRFTPTFYINRRRYDGPWDESSLVDAMLGTLGYRVRTAALDFASWGPSAGILLVLATVAAIAITNSPLGPAFEALLRQEFGLSLGDAAFRMSILHWINDDQYRKRAVRRHAGAALPSARVRRRRPKCRRRDRRRRLPHRQRSGDRADIVAGANA